MKNIGDILYWYMKNQVTQTPDVDAGSYITSKLSEHTDENILLLLSGGSALSIVPYIGTDILRANITVALVDERFTRSKEENNFLQLQKTNFYTIGIEKGVHFIDSVPLQDESYDDFTKRISEAGESYIHSNPDVYALGVFGIGEDGHTASIFSLPEGEFKELYGHGSFYTKSTAPNHSCSQRITINPNVIEEIMQDIVLYAVGSNKCDNILNYMHHKDFGIHQIPALIPAQHPRSILFTDCETMQETI